VIDAVREVAERIELEDGSCSASQLLERFLFPPAQQHQPLALLSGGERRRLHLCRLLMGAPNVLLLDEPTNDLDVHTLSVLEDFLEGFRGCVVVVSHDRWFLDRTVDRLFCFGAGRLQRYEGNYSSYLEKLAAAPPAAAGAAAPARAAASAAAPRRRRRRSFGENRELERIERELPAWEERRRLLEAQLSGPDAAGDHGRLEALSRELANLAERIEAAEERWLALSELPA
jgi:ATP-binding cassette subfamily F protein uup